MATPSGELWLEVYNQERNCGETSPYESGCQRFKIVLVKIVRELQITAAIRLCR